jgi:hypothetical protein
MVQIKKSIEMFILFGIKREVNFYLIPNIIGERVNTSFSLTQSVDMYLLHEVLNIQNFF